MNLGHCPLCWDGYEICKCTETELLAYEERLRKEQKKHEDKERQFYHDLLDKSFDRKKNALGIMNIEFPLYFSKQIIKQLNREQWLRMRAQFDKFFGVL